MVDLAPESFRQQVRDCLVHLYDFTELQTTPLADQIAPDLTGLQRVQVVRRVLIETVEQLKARETVGTPSRQERIYSLLLMRYIEGLSTLEVLQQLALSERQFYREHQRAIETVSQVLWERLKTSQTQDNMISVKSEIQRLSRQSSYAPVDLEALFSGVIAANVNLAKHRQITIHLHPLHTLDNFIVNQAVLRQMVIWMLSQIIKHVAEGSTVALSVTTVDQNPILNFEIFDSGIDLLVLSETLTNSLTATEFLAILKGTITTEETDHASYRVQFQLQRQHQVILVIDDNPDVVALLERYITGMPYEIVSAFEADEGFRLSQDLQPTWIVLDILLPHTDGWKILQSLKSHPRTRTIPVLVCSALDNPDLALSLGADAYLHKPPDRISFLQALER
jgi:CheY-like chemotaxis protein